MADSPGDARASDSGGRDPDVLTTDELAAKLGLSPQTVRKMAASGQIPAMKAGKNFRYSWSAVKQVLRQPYKDPGVPTDDHDPAPGTGAGYRAQRRARTNAEHTTD